MKTELTRRLELSQKMEQYDEHCKNILADKRILAWIMKETMKEFQSLEIDDIMQYIEGSPDVSSIPVDPGMTNSPVIHGIGTEGNIPYEGAVYFDIRFMAGLPKKETGIIVNLEAQKEMRRGYSIVTRGIFYGARMISAQMGTEFTAPDYQKIKKFFSFGSAFILRNISGMRFQAMAFRKTTSCREFPIYRKNTTKWKLYRSVLTRKEKTE